LKKPQIIINPNTDFSLSILELIYWKNILWSDPNLKNPYTVIMQNQESYIKLCIA